MKWPLHFANNNNNIQKPNQTGGKKKKPLSLNEKARETTLCLLACTWQYIL